jgi:hypothetical protein
VFKLLHQMPGARQSHSHPLELLLALVELVGYQFLLDDGSRRLQNVFNSLQALALDDKIAVIMTDYPSSSIDLAVHEIQLIKICMQHCFAFASMSLHCFLHSSM